MNAEALLRDAIREEIGEEVPDLNTPLRQLGFDSLDVVQLTLEVEEKIGTEIDPKKLYGVNTFSDLVAVIQEAMDAAGSNRL